MVKKRSQDKPLTEALAWRESWGTVLLRKYAGKYVAIRGRRVLAFAKSLATLHRELDRIGEWRVLIDRIESPGLVVY